MMNIIVSHILEAIFGLFLISILAKYLFGIDIVVEIMKFYNRIAYSKKNQIKRMKTDEEAY